MKKSWLVLVAILVVASFTMLFTGAAPSESDPKLPEAERSAATQDSIRGTDEIRMPSSIGEVVFPHLEHIDDFGIECTECHHEVNASVLNMPHEEYFKDFWIACGICHRDDAKPSSEPKACSACHHERPSSIADQTLSSKVVIHKNCWECHDIGTGAEASNECAFCHSGEKTPYQPSASSR